MSAANIHPIHSIEDGRVRLLIFDFCVVLESLMLQGYVEEESDKILADLSEYMGPWLESKTILDWVRGHKFPDPILQITDLLADTIGEAAHGEEGLTHTPACDNADAALRIPVAREVLSGFEYQFVRDFASKSKLAHYRNKGFDA